MPISVAVGFAGGLGATGPRAVTEGIPPPSDLALDGAGATGGRGGAPLDRSPAGGEYGAVVFGLR